MGQKVNPVGLRISINRGWDSNWFAKGKEYTKWLHQDIKIRDSLHKMLKRSAVSKIEIERLKDTIILFIKTARPAMILGDSGKNLEVISKNVHKVIKDRKIKIKMNVIEIRKPELDAQLVADNIANQISNRASFRTVQKFAIKKARKAGALGIKTSVSGRLNEVDMARTEGYLEGSVPLATLRSDIDYATSEADTTYGKIGVKVWIYKGSALSFDSSKNNKRFDNRKNDENRFDNRKKKQHPFNNKKPFFRSDNRNFKNHFNKNNQKPNSENFINKKPEVK